MSGGRVLTNAEAVRCLTTARAIANELWQVLTRDQLIVWLEHDDEDPDEPTLWDALVIRLNTAQVGTFNGAPEWMTRSPADKDRPGS